MVNSKFIVLDRRTACTSWYDLWSSFGFNDHQWLSRIAKVEEYTHKLFEDKLLLYKEQIEKRRQLLKQLVYDYEYLLERTGLSSSIQATIFDRLKLKEQEVYIDRKMQELLINQGQLIYQRNELENQKQYLCQLLNSTPIESFDQNTCISLVEINKRLQDHIKMLKELQNSRLIQVSSYYYKLKNYSEQLEWTPSSSESTIEYLLLEQFDRCLTVDSLNEIESTINQLENQIEIQKVRFFQSYNYLQHLYKCLKKDPEKDYCLAYKTGHEHINEFTIKQLEHEIRQCRQERMKNGREYCHLIHQQIIDVLEKAHLNNNDERMILNKLTFETLSPELLDAYDAELERITQLYKKRQPVLDAYHRWLSLWNEFTKFTKVSTDPGRFRTRGYNAEIEERTRKTFYREILIVEQKFLNILSEHNDPLFLIDNVSIRQKFHEAHQQTPYTVMQMKRHERTPIASRILCLTPIQSRKPMINPCRIVNRKPFLLGTAVTCRAKRAPKTPTTTFSRKSLNKKTNHTMGQLKRSKPRSKPRSPPSSPSRLLQSSPKSATPIKLPIHSSIGSNDQSLDFSHLHTMKNVYGQIKVMTSTPNSSFINIENYRTKTTCNKIGQRKSKRKSKLSVLPSIIIQGTNDKKTMYL